uniref:Uncharacterized protein n=1 Tax=Anguilla anguilla TaxID=7936 RepID=A0A0E9XZI0_ANGAN
MDTWTFSSDSFSASLWTPFRLSGSPPDQQQPIRSLLSASTR